MPKNEADFKWTCRKCTYGNWPNSTRCIMCRFSPQTSCRTSPVPDLVEQYDIKKELICSDNCQEDVIMNNEKNGIYVVNPEKNLKWKCSSCSYLNWIQSQFCIMCKFIKPNELISVESLKNIENIIDGPQKDRSKCTTLGKGHKWICMKCTYENWPRSHKCVICQYPKNKNFIKEDTGKGSDRFSIQKVKTNKSPPKMSPTFSPNFVSRSAASNILEMCKDNDRYSEISTAMGRLCIKSDNQRLHQIRNKLTSKDYLWLAACQGVAEHEIPAVSNYLALGGEKTRQLTFDEVSILNETDTLAKWEPGHSLVHLAIKYQQEDILRMLLMSDGQHRTIKKLPCHVCPDLSTSIRKQLSHSLRSAKGDFPCPFFTDIVTFSLPGEILELDSKIQHQLFSEILDHDVRKVLEDELLINWSEELMTQYGSCLYPLWNRAAGDCLLDSVLQATWGVFDRDNFLRRRLYEALSDGYQRFFPRWQEAEQLQASEMNYSLEEDQWKNDWSNIVGLAATAGNSLEQAHVFALTHILRRPIIIYAVKYVKSLHGETIDLARFEGVYLPLLWDEGFCWKNPIVLGYTRGHFSALLPMERLNYANYAGAGAHVEWNEDDAHVTYLPLIDHDGHLLPIHFLTLDEVGQEEQLLQKCLDCCLTDGGILACKQIITPMPVSVGQMIDEWLNRYRKMHIETTNSKGTLE